MLGIGYENLPLTGADEMDIEQGPKKSVSIRVEIVYRYLLPIIVVYIYILA